MGFLLLVSKTSVNILLCANSLFILYLQLTSVLKIKNDMDVRLTIHVLSAIITGLKIFAKSS